MSAPLKDSAYLLKAGRYPAVPFRLPIRIDGLTSELTCTRVVRVVPKRRLVFFGQWNGEAVVLKCFLSPRRGPYQMTREAAGLSALAAAGIPAPGVLFEGSLLPGRLPVLGLRRLLRARSFSKAWDEAAGREARGDLLARAVGLVAEQHQAGIKQDDLHKENFLIRGSDVYVIDGASVDVRQPARPLGEGASLRNLALLFTHLARADYFFIEDTFRIYRRHRGWGDDPRRYARLLELVEEKSEVQRRAWLKKIFRESTSYVCRRSWRRVMVCRRPDYSPAMKRFLADPDPAIAGGRCLKAGNTSTVALVEVDGVALAVKRYNIKNIGHLLRRCLRPTRAHTSWKNSHLLDHILVPTPRPVAFMETRWGPFRSKAYFISQYVAGPDAHAVLHARGADKREARRIAADFGGILQNLADHMISHGDLKATNFIAAADRLWTVDLDAMRRHRSPGRFQRAFDRDLKRLMKNWDDLPATAKVFRRMLATLGPPGEREESAKG